MKRYENEKSKETIRNPFSEPPSKVFDKPFDAIKTADNFYEQFLKGNPLFDYDLTISNQENEKRVAHTPLDQYKPKNNDEQVIVVRYKKNEENITPKCVKVEYPNGGKYHEDDESALCAAIGIIMSDSIGKNGVLNAEDICSYMIKSMIELLNKIMVAAFMLGKK